MLKQIKMLIAGFLSCIILLVGIGAYAAIDAQIKATQLNNVKIKLYGKDYTIKNTGGTVLKPISYNVTFPSKQLRMD